MPGTTLANACIPARLLATTPTAIPAAIPATACIPATPRPR